jgi:amino acid adenylation domain-containing protein
MTNPVDKRKNIETMYPLSPMQQGMLFHTLLTPDAGVYIPQVCFDLTGPLNIAALQQAWQDSLNQHATLRTAFYWERRDKPFQVVFRQVALPWDNQDWQTIPLEQQPAQLEDFLQRDRQQGFELQHPPLMRLTLIQRSSTQFYLIWTQHHLLLDGWSAALLINQVFSRYFAPDRSLPTPRPYGDYIAWLNQQDQPTAQTFWKQYLQGFTQPTGLSFLAGLGNLTQSTPRQLAEQQQQLSPTTTTALQAFAQQHQLTLSTVMQGAFALLLSRYNDCADVVFGVTSSGRPATLAGVESMVGLFINTLPLRVQVDGRATLISWLQTLQTQQAEAIQYEYTSLLDIQSWSELPAGAGLFDSILVMENYPVTATTAAITDLHIEAVRSLEWTSFPITLLVSGSEQLKIQIKFDQTQFSADMVDQLLTHFCHLLQGMIDQPHSCLSEIELLTSTEQQQMQQWHQTTAFYPPICIHQQFETQVVQTPDTIAVTFANQSLTYTELNQRANQLAHYLQSSGIQPDVPVAVLLPRSLELAIAVLAVLKAGGAYVPLEPSYPTERLEWLLQDTQAPVLITQSAVATLSTPATVICLDQAQSAIAQHANHNPTRPVDLDDAIYILYTSGSTGIPKGVINTHRGISNRLVWMQHQFHLTPADVVLQKTPFSFDVSVWEFFWTWLQGAHLVMAKPDGHQDTHYLVEMITTHQVTTIHFVPSMLSVFLEADQVTQCTSLKRVICSGEILPAAVQNRFFETLNAELYNLYGPTEAAIDVSYWQCQPEVNQLSIPIGYPIANTQLYILNASLQPVPIGVPGELYIGGVGVARGYLNQPELTAERFIPYPKSLTSRFPLPPLARGESEAFKVPLVKGDLGESTLYKTGDRARYRLDGAIAYLGRLDDQIKLRGFRIELGEIEAVLQQHPTVKQVAVVASGAEEYRQLIAYLTLTESAGDATPLPDWRSFLVAKLPAYMVPTQYVVCDRLPTTPNGKLDRKALQLHPPHVSTPAIAPRNSTETIILEIWQTILCLETVSVTDNFFELGGNSLLATRVNSRLREAFQLDLPLRSLFEHPTIAALAEQIQALQLTLQHLQTVPVSTPGRKEIEL